VQVPPEVLHGLRSAPRTVLASGGSPILVKRFPGTCLGRLVRWLTSPGGRPGTGIGPEAEPRRSAVRVVAGGCQRRPLSSAGTNSWVITDPENCCASRSFGIHLTRVALLGRRVAAIRVSGENRLIFSTAHRPGVRCGPAPVTWGWQRCQMTEAEGSERVGAISYTRFRILMPSVAASPTTGNSAASSNARTVVRNSAWSSTTSTLRTRRSSRPIPAGIVCWATVFTVGRRPIRPTRTCSVLISGVVIGRR
jgi:hypothetical protein